MRHLVRLPVPAIVAAMLVAASCPRPASAAALPSGGFDQIVQAWMGTVAFLADDDADEEEGHRGERHRRDDGDDRGERRHCEGGECEKCRGERGHGERHHGERHHGERGHGPRTGMEGPRMLMAKMDEILARLSRIEGTLDGRAGGPPRGEWHGPRHSLGGHGPRPEMPEEVREQMRKRMQEGRERMDQARQAFRQMEERIKKLEAEIERLKAER